MRAAIDACNLGRGHPPAGVTIPLVDKSFTPDKAAGGITDGTENTLPPYLKKFPYLGTPSGGYQTTPGTPGGF